MSGIQWNFVKGENNAVTGVWELSVKRSFDIKKKEKR